MDFTLPEAAVTLAGLTRKILADRTPTDGLDKPLWTDLAQAGVLSATLPEAAGGEGYGLLEQCAIATEIGRSALGLPYVDTILAAATTIARVGSADQQQRWAAPAGRGELILTVAPTAVLARQSGDGWALSGSVEAVPAAPYADAILVPSTAGVFIVAPSDAGVHLAEQRIAGGPGAGAVDLAGVVLGPDRLLSVPVDWLRDRATVGLCATQLGVLERAVELTAEYARTRVQFGKAIGGFQAVAARLADAYIDVEGVRLTTAQAAWLMATDRPAPTEVATAKFWAADAGHRVAHTAVHVHGGVGIDLDHILQRYFLAAKYLEFTLGGATEQLLRLGEALRTVELEA